MIKRKRPLDDSEIYELLNASDDDFSDYELESSDPEYDSSDEREEEATHAPWISEELSWQTIDLQESVRIGSVPSFSGKHCVIGFDNLTPYECFEKFFPSAIYDLVAAETNRYAQAILASIELAPRSRYRQWKDLCAKDIMALVAVEIGMGLVRKPSLSYYFQNSFWLTRTPGFGSLMSRNQYQLMRSFLHFSNNADDDGNNRLFKIRKVLELVEKTYTSCYHPHKELSVDETMVKFKGRVFFKQYLLSKPSSKWGVKVFSLCDSTTGFLLKFRVYTGKEVIPERGIGLGHRITKELLEEFQKKGHVIYMDNFYSSVQLFEDLMQQDTGACGTVRPNRKGLPKDMKQTKLKKGDLPKLWLTEDKALLACTWQDTGKVNMFSTIGDFSVTDVTVKKRTGPTVVPKPSIQVLYNKHMGGVDKFDQLCESYNFNRRSKKWYQILWHFVIEVALVNGRICYNATNSGAAVSQTPSRKRVIDGLLQGYKRKRSSKVGRPFTTPLEDS